MSVFRVRKKKFQILAFDDGANTRIDLVLKKFQKKTIKNKGKRLK